MIKKRHYAYGLVALLTILIFATVHYVPDAIAARRARQHAFQLTGGDPDRGHAAIRGYGCGSCHTIPGVRDADALVGPPLTRVDRRMYVAGVLPNTPENLIRWIQNPPAVDPLTAMPNLRVTDADARDIAAYLYSSR